jgi:hypothetical protein
MVPRGPGAGADANSNRSAIHPMRMPAAPTSAPAQAPTSIPWAPAASAPTSTQSWIRHCVSVEGLRIADASVMPTSPSANTNATVLAIAERAAAMLM